MKIGVIGTGNMGRHLGLLWAEQGHEVFFGSRTVAKAEAAAALSPHTIKTGTNDEAARFGDVLLYTIRDADPNALVDDPATWDGKVVIDVNNLDVPDGLDYPSFELSIAQKIQAQIPNAHVVKAFNTTPIELFELCPDLVKPYEVSIFLATDDDAARATVAQLVTDLGFVPVDCGPLYAAKSIERAAQLIIGVIISSGQFLTTLSTKVLPQPERAARLGGREMSEQQLEDLRSLEAS